MENKKFISSAGELRRVAVLRASSILQDSCGAEDVAQEVMLKLWQVRDKLDLDSPKILGFANTLSRNISLNKLRSEKRMPKAQVIADNDDDGDLPDYLSKIGTSETPDSKMEDDENQRIFNQAMEMLPYNWRTVLRMRNIDEMEFADIAKVLDTTESSVRGILSKARMQMLKNINLLRK